jgi:hypothetical protein
MLTSAQEFPSVWSRFGRTLVEVKMTPPNRHYRRLLNSMESFP